MLLSSSHAVVESLCSQLRAGETVYLATVLSTWGSSPRPPGSVMVWSESSGVTGSVSGGCVEEGLLGKLLAGTYTSICPRLLCYGDNPQQTGNVKLPCGAVLRILLEKVEPADLSLWSDICGLLAQRKGVSRAVDLQTGEWSFKNTAPHRLGETATRVETYLGPTRKLLIVGANDIARFLASYAHSLDFDVSLCDPRLATEPWQETHFRYYACYPDGVVEQHFSDQNSAIVAVSHDPRLDDMALIEALQSSEAFYIGAMGSVRTTQARHSRLLELEIIASQLERLHAPVGLDIGSKTPAEIAISIAAHLVGEYTQHARQQG